MGESFFEKVEVSFEKGAEENGLELKMMKTLAEKQKATQTQQIAVEEIVVGDMPSKPKNEKEEDFVL